MKSIDLNADVGEGGSEDAPIIALVTSANISCGAHAGNPATIRSALAQCRTHGVAAGAHPGYADPDSFGRRALHPTPAVLRSQLLRQLESFAAAAQREQVQISHAKPHGALYAEANHSPELAATLVECVCEVLGPVALLAPPSGCLSAAAVQAGIRHVAEGFADRRYLADGSLVPRSHPQSVIANPIDCAQQALSIALDATATALDASTFQIMAQSLCIHGDTPGSLDRLRAVREALQRAGCRLEPAANADPYRYANGNLA